MRPVNHEGAFPPCRGRFATPVRNISHQELQGACGDLWIIAGKLSHSGDAGTFFLSSFNMLMIKKFANMTYPL
jgi:hypothetical protein